MLVELCAGNYATHDGLVNRACKLNFLAIAWL